MSRLQIPAGYSNKLTAYETQTAIGLIKRTFEDELGKALNLKRVSAPLFVDPHTGLNDNLNGVERPVSFDIPATGSVAEVVHSLAKWKRMALAKYGFPAGEGLYTDMNAIRRDEELDNLHSIYVDQWDWERVITVEQRTKEFLRFTVCRIVNAIIATQQHIKTLFPSIDINLCPEVSFVTTSELEAMWPQLTPKQRENEYLRLHHTAFIMEIGDSLPLSGKPHDGRAPDYDDWQLNGDIMFWNELLGCAFEVSSMGIRVSPESLSRQLSLANCDDRRTLPFHSALLAGELPYTVGGGIGQSRLCMLLLQKAHVGEVQVSVWDRATLDGCAAAGIEIL